MKLRALLFVACSTSLAGCVFNVEAVEAEVEAIYEGDDFETLRVHSDGLGRRLTVLGHPHGGVRAIATVEGLVGGGEKPDLEAEINLKLEKQGEVLALVADYEGEESESMSLVTLKVEAPEQAALDIEVVEADVEATCLQSSVSAVSVSGDLEVDTRGALDLETTSGDIDAVGASGEVSTVSGDLQLTLGGSGTLSSTSGDIRAELQVGGLVDTVSGEVEITLADEAAEGLRVETTSGDVTVHIGVCSGFDLELDTLSGDLSIEACGQCWRAYSDYSGSLAGGGPRITVSTTSGDVRIVD